ncbi:FMN-binding protein [Wukongibacter baidiensis]|uniref:FMN-binding protein n=1 Tax=Wukongibacter baidiensis TaxID=1723361 RepID=UPI003D7FEEB2
MLNKKLILVTLIGLLVFGVLAGCTKSQDVSQEPSELTFEEWASQEPVWPEWAEPIEVEINEETMYGPTSVRKTFDLETARENIAKMRYLVENSEDTDEYPYHNIWKSNLGSGLLKLGENHLAYHYLNEIVNLSPEANYGTEKVDEKKVPKPIGDKARKIAHGRMLKAIAKAGYADEVMSRYGEFDYQANGEVFSWQLTSAAWAMGIIGEEEEAYKLFEYSVTPENFGDLYPWQASSNVLDAASYAYAKGDYDKVLDFTERLISEGIDSTSKAYFLDNDIKEGRKAKYFNRHWKSSYKLAEGFRKLATRAKNGEVPSFTDLKDGVYTSSNTGYMLTPIEVTVTVKDGKVTDIKATQEDPKDDRPGTGLESLPPRIVEAQSLEIDSISSATISSESIKMGVAQALLKAKK